MRFSLLPGPAGPSASSSPHNRPLMALCAPADGPGPSGPGCAALPPPLCFSLKPPGDLHLLPSSSSERENSFYSEHQDDDAYLNKKRLFGLGLGQALATQFCSDLCSFRDSGTPGLCSGFLTSCWLCVRDKPFSCSQGTPSVTPAPWPGWCQLPFPGAQLEPSSILMLMGLPLGLLFLANWIPSPSSSVPAQSWSERGLQGFQPRANETDTKRGKIPSFTFC